MSRTVLALLALVALGGVAGCLADHGASRDPANATGGPQAEGDAPEARYGPGATPTGNASAGVAPWYTLTGFEGAEPSLGAIPDGTLFTVAGDRTLRSTDGGRSWEPVHDYLEVAGTANLDSADPWLTTDRSEGTLYTLHMYEDAACNSLFVSSDGGDSFDHEPAACGSPVADHPKLGVGPPGPEVNPLAESGDDRVLYLCYNKLATSACAASYDGGRTWPVEVPVPIPDDCSGINGPVTVGPDGAAVVPQTLNCERLYLGVSTDTGASWTVRPGPQGPGATGQDAGLAFDDEGTLYVTWRGDDQRLYLARTPDLGQTWAGPWTVSPPGVSSTVFQTLEAGEPGRVALATLGTRDTGERAGAAPAGTVWHLYLVTSTTADADEPVFDAYQVTPDEDPVQVGCAFDGTGRGDCRNMLDFIDAAMAPDGSFVVSYTEGCVEACQGSNHPSQSNEQQAAIAGLRGFDLLPD